MLLALCHAKMRCSTVYYADAGNTRPHFVMLKCVAVVCTMLLVMSRWCCWLLAVIHSPLPIDPRQQLGTGPPPLLDKSRDATLPIVGRVNKATFRKSSIALRIR